MSYGRADNISVLSKELEGDKKNMTETTRDTKFHRSSFEGSNVMGNLQLKFLVDSPRMFSAVEKHS